MTEREGERHQMKVRGAGSREQRLEQGQEASKTKAQLGIPK